MKRWTTALACALALGLVPAALAQEEVGRVETLPPVGDHWVWVNDLLLAHSLLFDGDSGEVLGSIDAFSSISPKPPLYSEARGEFYSVEIDYSRGLRGVRTDFVTIHDARTLEVKGEIVFPTRAAESATSIAYTALLDGDRFLAVFSQFPNAAVAILDLAERRFVGDVPLAGCAGIYPVAERRFLSLCGDGTVLQVGLDAEGRVQSTLSSEAFFEAVEDPAMLAGVRLGSRWLFTSFTGKVFDVEGTAEPPVVSEWSLVDEAQAGDGWRPGGKQHMALHRAEGLLYVVFHQGKASTHKDPGREIWVFDLESRERTARLSVPNLTAAFLGQTLGVEDGGFLDWLLGALLPDEGAHSIAVTQDASPLLFARNASMGVVAVLDARSGDHLRDLTEVGLVGNRLEVLR
ncbi:MAG: amine dehydrogenase large subunit [Myxococcota bacterium]|nr:amine dehydrogenase large subunit [Myxococcota bacterium]